AGHGAAAARPTGAGLRRGSGRLSQAAERGAGETNPVYGQRPLVRGRDRGGLSRPTSCRAGLSGSERSGPDSIPADVPLDGQQDSRACLQLRGGVDPGGAVAPAGGASGGRDQPQSVGGRTEAGADGDQSGPAEFRGPGTPADGNGAEPTDAVAEKTVQPVAPG